MCLPILITIEVIKHHCHNVHGFENILKINTTSLNLLSVKLALSMFKIAPYHHNTFTLILQHLNF